MKKRWKSILAGILTGVLLCTGTALTAFADSEDAVVAMGANLNASERAAVLSQLGLTEEQLSSYKVITVTNEEEHEYLDSYLPASVIGTRALSSCAVYRAKEGNGIDVETHNITYCTKEMYQNALATAGVKNAKVVVAAPFNISGTAALVGAIKAYAEQEGILITPESIDGATQEIVATGQVAESIGDQSKAAQLIAAVKEVVVEKGLSGDEEIGKLIDDVASQLSISLSAEDRQLIIDLMKKISELDIDIRALTEQAGDVYDALRNQGIDLSEYGITKDDVNGFLGILQRIWESIVSLFRRG